MCNTRRISRRYSSSSSSPTITCSRLTTLNNTRTLLFQTSLLVLCITQQFVLTSQVETFDEDANLCNYATLDAIFNSAEGITYVFKGQHYWKLTEDSIEPGYPKLISKSWQGLPGNIDAAFTYKNGRTFFFKGSEYWRYDGKIMEGDYPRKISDGFPGIPNDIDAAMIWGNGKIYFYKGSKFWRFDPSAKTPITNSYPKEISNWEGIPNDLDAALHDTNGEIYFFKDGYYYRFNNATFSVDVADPPFPRPTGNWWFGCQSGNGNGSCVTKELQDNNNIGKNTDTIMNPDVNYEEDAELCNNGTIDTIFNSAQCNTYVFKGEHYWKLTEDSIALGYPRLINKSWPGLPGNLDAAFSHKRSGRTFFFKGSEYWRYDGKNMEGNYPRKISDGFPGIPNDIDAAMIWGGNGMLYFFKGSKFWRFDSAAKPPISNSYPKEISNWEGVPNDLDAALHYTNGYTYFFRQGVYYRFNDRTFSVDVADPPSNPPFPRPVSYWWFGCRSVTKGGGASVSGELHN